MQEEIPAFMRVAEMLKVKGLTENAAGVSSFCLWRLLECGMWLLGKEKKIIFLFTKNGHLKPVFIMFLHEQFVNSGFCWSDN